MIGEWISNLSSSSPSPGATSDRSSSHSPELAPVASHLLDLDDALLLSILLLLSKWEASQATASCKQFRALAADGLLWRAMVSERHPDHSTWTLQQWGLPSHRALLEAIESFVIPWTSGYWLLATDHPWCQLVRVQLDNARLVAVALRPQLRRRTATGSEPAGSLRQGARVALVADPHPLFRIGFRASSPPGAATPGLCGTPLVELHATVHGRPAWVLPGTPPSDGPGDLRAAVSSTPYPPPVPYAFLAGLYHGEDPCLLRVSWQPSTEPPEAGEVDALNGNTLVPPLSSEWVVRNLEQKWRLARQSPLANDPKRKMGTSIALARLPAFPTLAQGGGSGGGSRAPWPAGVDSTALPLPGLYAANYGDHYLQRSVEVIALRVLRMSDSIDERRRLHLQGEPISRLGACCLVAIKVCGDFHVPSGACTFYAPLLITTRADSEESATHRTDGSYPGAFEDVPVDPLPYEGAAEADLAASVTHTFRGYGCLALPGFQSPEYTEGRLLVLEDREAFAFEWDGEFRHLYHRLPDGDAMRGVGMGVAEAPPPVDIN